MSQQLTHERKVKCFILNEFILHPATVPFDPTVSFGPIRCSASNGRQLTASGLDYPSRHRCQRAQPTSRITLWFSRKQLFHSHSDGTIDSTIVHWFTPVLPCREKT
jgi:hypothetical protein